MPFISDIYLKEITNLDVTFSLSSGNDNSESLDDKTLDVKGV